MPDREILFRGRRLTDGKRIYGNLVWTDEGVFIIQNYVPRHMLSKYEVGTSTVSQYTGLTDKHGTRIFEGDVIHAHYVNCPKCDQREVVVFLDGAFKSQGGDIFAPLPGRAKHLVQDKSVYMEWCEVIGNRWDNPELMEENT